MTKEFKYQLPIKYLFVGLSGLGLFSMFGLAVIKIDEIWFAIIFGIFSLMGLGMGIAFLTIFFRNFIVGKLKLGNDFIEIPRRWKNKTKLNFSDITKIAELDSYDNIIKIQTQEEVILIEKNWMKHKEFDEVKKKLHKYWMGK